MIILTVYKLIILKTYMIKLTIYILIILKIYMRILTIYIINHQDIDDNINYLYN